MENIDLFEYADENGIEIDYYDLPNNKALSVKIGQDEYIGIDKSVAADSPQERVLLAHEIGHCATGTFYSDQSTVIERRRCEHKAVKWALLHCVPKHELMQLLREKYNDFEIAEHFGVTYDFINTAYMYYFRKGVTA